MTEYKYQKSPLLDIISYAIATASNDSVQRALSKGVSSYQEQYAYSYVIPRVERKDEDRALKIVGLLAKAKVVHNKELTFGAWCARLNAQQVERRLLQIQNLPMEDALNEISRLLQMATAKQRQEGFNWYHFADMMYYWGKKTTESSTKTRQQVLRDYYRSAAYKQKIKDKEDPTDNPGKNSEEDSHD